MRYQGHPAVGLSLDMADPYHVTRRSGFTHEQGGGVSGTLEQIQDEAFRGACGKKLRVPCHTALVQHYRRVYGGGVCPEPWGVMQQGCFHGGGRDGKAGSCNNPREDKRQEQI